MIRPSWKYLLVGAIMTGSLAADASRADAHLLWWRHYPVASWWCGPVCGAVCDPCVVWYRAWRPVYRMTHWPWHWCSRCCTWCEWCVCDPCCCEEGAAVSQGTAPRQPTEKTPTLAPQKSPEGAGKAPTPPDTGNLPGPGGTESQPKPSAASPNKATLSSPGADGILTLQVPAEAKVFINGHETRSQGTRREYVSAGLVPGKLYPYAVTVMTPRASQAGAQPQWDSRVETVYLKAGEDLSLNFNRTTNHALVARGQ